MGNQKQKWKAEEEEALLAGIAKHGPGKWKNILKDPEFAPFLTQRSNIDLKDKWRNLSVSTSAQGSKEKFRAPKAKAIAAVPPSNNHLSAPTTLRYIASAETATDDPSHITQDGKNAPKYNAMIFEALSTIKDNKGCDLGAIVNFIKQRHEVPPNFRRLLSSRLGRLVAQGKLEKIQNCFKLKTDNLLGTKTPTSKQKDARQRLTTQYMRLKTASETVEDAAKAAAYKLADAEIKSYLAAEAVTEAERITKMAEDTDSMLQLLKEIYEQCSGGAVVTLA